MFFNVPNFEYDLFKKAVEFSYDLESFIKKQKHVVKAKCHVNPMSSNIEISFLVNLNGKKYLFEYIFKRDIFFYRRYFFVDNEMKKTVLKKAFKEILDKSNMEFVFLEEIHV